MLPNTTAVLLAVIQGQYTAVAALRNVATNIQTPAGQDVWLANLAGLSALFKNERSTFECLSNILTREDTLQKSLL